MERSEAPGGRRADSWSMRLVEAENRWLFALLGLLLVAGWIPILRWTGALWALLGLAPPLVAAWMRVPAASRAALATLALSVIMPLAALLLYPVLLHVLGIALILAGTGTMEGLLPALPEAVFFALAAGSFVALRHYVRGSAPPSGAFVLALWIATVSFSLLLAGAFLALDDWFACAYHVLFSQTSGC